MAESAPGHLVVFALALMATAPRTLYVGNLPFSASESELKELFSAWGEVRSVRLILDSRSGRFRGFGFVSFNDAESASRAHAEMDGRPLDGRPLRISLAQPLRSPEDGESPSRTARPTDAGVPFDKTNLKRPLGPREDAQDNQRAQRRAQFESDLDRRLHSPRSARRP